MENGFDRKAFMAYMENTFNGFETPFLRQLVDNVIDYAQKHERVSKDQFVYFVSDVIPEISFGEVAQFMDDECLTAYSQAEKQDWLQKHSNTLS